MNHHNSQTRTSDSNNKIVNLSKLRLGSKQLPILDIVLATETATLKIELPNVAETSTENKEYL